MKQYIIQIGESKNMVIRVCYTIDIVARKSVLGFKTRSCSATRTS